MTEPSNQNKCLVISAVLLLAGVACIIVVAFRLREDERESKPITLPPQRQTQLSITSLERPLPRPQGYMGSESCRDCHESIYERYSVSPMGQSLAAVDKAARLSGESSGSFHPPGPRRYEIVSSPHGMEHTEVLLDEKGDPVYSHSEQIAFVLGSGRRGRSYLIHADGALYQSPIGWYAASRAWDLSPGYEAESHPRFSRLVGDSCLYCHAGRTNSTGVNADRYDATVFSEGAIGCERCHGPGENHIALHETGERVSPSGHDIIHPGELSSGASDSVCNQCHVFGQSVVPRYGREFFDFRPGDNLEDVFVILERTHMGSGPQSIRAVSQVEQMRSSVCYTASDGKMKCISCHDPHSTYRGVERDTFYRQRCLKCHETNGCAEPLAVRQQSPAENSCIHCHMPALPATSVPHTSLTHHGIPRRPDGFVLAGGPSARTEAADLTGIRAGLRVFADGAQKIPAVEVDRAKAIAMMSAAWPIQHQQLASMAVVQLLELLPPPEVALPERVAMIDDVAFLRELGSGFFILNRHESAEICWKRVHELAPDDETALLGLVKLSEAKRDITAARQYLHLLKKSSPHSEETWSISMMAGVFAGDTAAVIESGKRLLRLNPGLIKTHNVLADAYRRAGDTTLAEHHKTMAERLTKAMKDPQ